jgi:hypothetical protein
MMDVRTRKDAQVMLQNKSEVAQLKEQMVAEYEAGKRGLVGLAQGTLQHEFIQRKMETMQHCHHRLITLVGQEQAGQLIAEAGL